MPDPARYDGRVPEPPCPVEGEEAERLRAAIQAFCDAAYVDENTGEWAASGDAFRALFAALD